MKDSKNELIKACKEANQDHDDLGLQNWHKLVKFLLKTTNLSPGEIQNENESGQIINAFKQNIKLIYQNWWHEKLMSDENKKLKFFFKYKKIFKFEKYLDSLPRHIRMYTSRLRSSSHNYPIETLRYCKPKVESKDRKCNICTTNEVGDEHHYLAKCTNESIVCIRQTFLTRIRNTSQLDKLSNDNIIEYCLLMHDIKTIQDMGLYIKDIANAYREESKDKKVEAPKITRSGRLSKKPDKLNL